MCFVCSEPTEHQIYWKHINKLYSIHSIYACYSYTQNTVLSHQSYITKEQCALFSTFFSYFFFLFCRCCCYSLIFHFHTQFHAYIRLSSVISVSVVDISVVLLFLFVFYGHSIHSLTHTDIHTCKKGERKTEAKPTLSNSHFHLSFNIISMAFSLRKTI